MTGRLSGSRSVDDLGLANAGSATAEELGYGLATGADLDGDGVDDLVLGTPFTDDPATDAGAAFVLPGPIGSGSTEADAWFTWTGTADVYNVGATIGVGDFDGDGEGDLFVAAPADHEVVGRFGPIRAGEATVDSADVRVAGAFYQSIELGDVTGDGVDELVFGDWGSSRVFVYEGGSRSTSLDSGDRLALIDTDYSGESCGYTVLAGVDTDGDGVGDVVAGAPALNGETGRVVGVHGPIGRTTYAEEDLDFTIDGTATGGWFGVGLAAGGDLDDDGEPALVVGAPQADDGARTSAGAVYLFDGLRSGAHDADDASITLTGTKGSQLLGYGVVTADVDGDGAVDLAFSGDRTDDDLVEAVYVFYGAWE